MDQEMQQAWNDKWKNECCPWHSKVPNRHLTDFFSKLMNGDEPSGERILVPMCGKTVDLLWLYEQGLDVVGIELSEIACKQFFEENGLKYSLQELSPEFKAFVYDDRLRIIQGDILQVSMSVISGGKFGFAYDCHAISALEYEMHEKYLENIKSLLKFNARILLQSFDYDPSLQIHKSPQIYKSPVAMTTEVVNKLYGRNFTIELLERTPAKDVLNRVYIGVGEDAVVYLFQRN